MAPRSAEDQNFKDGLDSVVETERARSPNAIAE